MLTEVSGRTCLSFWEKRRIGRGKSGFIKSCWECRVSGSSQVEVRGVGYIENKAAEERVEERVCAG